MARRRKRPKALEDAIRSGKDVIISEKLPSMREPSTPSIIPPTLRKIIESALKPIKSTRTPLTLGGAPTGGATQLRETESEKRFRLEREKQRRKRDK